MKGKILFFGAEGGSEVLQCMLLNNDYFVQRIHTRAALEKALSDTDSLLLLYDFHTEACNQADTLGYLSRLRSMTPKPILGMCTKQNQMLPILALNSGADDVLRKEDSELEMVARIKSQIRFYERLTTSPKQDRVLSYEGIEMNDNTKTVSLHGNKVILTPTEYKILQLFLQNPGKVYSNKEIYENIWKMDPVGAENTIAVHIRHMREKLEVDPKKPTVIRMIWGQGYKVG